MDTTSDYNSPDREERLEEILAEYLDAIDAGETPDRQAWLAKHPEFVDDMRRFFAAQDQFAPLRPRRDSHPRAIRYVGDYELLEELGRGGMGVVYKARQVSLNRTVAVKLILDSRLVSETDVRRFHVEAEAAANLQHPGIVPVYEVGQHEGQHYFSMAYIEGRTLAALIREGPLPAADAARYVRQVAQAIHYAHQQGTLHRDIKPSNILIDRDDQPHITDFGLAKRVADDSSLTRSGAVVGTPSYLSPEQALSQQEDLGPPTDVYSLGATLYAALIGRPPFQAANVVDTLQQVILNPPVSPRALNPAVPRDLETICLKCLDKERGKRYATAAELGEDLQRWHNGEPIRARPVDAAERFWRWCKRQPLIAALAATAILCLIFGTLVSTYFAIEERKRAKESAANAAQAESNLQEAEVNARRAASNAKDAMAAANREAIERREAERQLRVSNALRLASQSGQLLTQNPQRSLLLAVESLKATMNFGESRLTAAEQALRDALRLLGGTALPSGAGPVAISPDGHWLVTNATRDGVSRLWDLTAIDPAAKAVMLPETEKSHSWSCGFLISPDSHWLVTTATSDGAARLWDLNAKDPAAKAAVLPGVKGQGFATPRFAVSPDSHWLVTTSVHNGTTWLWDLTAKAPTATAVALHGHNPIAATLVVPGRGVQIARLLISPDSHWLVTESYDNTARLWDLTAKDPAVTVVVLHDGGGCEGVLISQDSHWLVTISGDNRTAQLWDLTAKDLAVTAVMLRGHDKPIRLYPGAISPDSHWLVTASADNTARLWDLTAKDPAATAVVLRGHERGIDHVTISPDAHWLITGSVDGTARLWDLTVKAPAAAAIVLPGLERVINPLIIVSPDSRWLIARGDSENTARLWDLTTKDPAATAVVLRGHETRIVDVAVSPDGRWLSTRGDRENLVRLWDLTAEDPAAAAVVLRGHENKISVTFSPDSRWLVSSTPTSARLWALAKLQRSAATIVLRGHKAPIYHAVISPDSHWLITHSYLEHTVHLWDLNTPNPATTADELRGHDKRIDQVAISPDSRWLVTGSEDCTARLWDLTAKDPAAAAIVFRGHTRPIRAIEISPDSHWLVTMDWENTAKLWDLTAEDPATAIVLRGHEARIADFIISRDSHWLVTVGDKENTARLWNLTAKNPASTAVVLGGHTEPVKDVAISPDSHWLVTMDHRENSARLWDLTAKNPTMTAAMLRGKQNEIVIRSCVVSSDSHWLVTGCLTDSNMAWLWDLTAKAPTTKTAMLPGVPVDNCGSLAISQDSHWLVTEGDDLSLRLWNLTAKDPASKALLLGKRAEGGSTIAISLDSRWLVNSTDAPVTRLWDLTAKDPAANEVVLLGRLCHVSMKNLGHLLVTEQGQRVLLWDLTAKNPAATGITVCGEEEASRFKTISRDGHWLVTADDHGTAYLWNLRLKELMAIAPKVAGRELTAEERKQYLLSPDR